jgi:hypothetical protein
MSTPLESMAVRVICSVPSRTAWIAAPQQRPDDRAAIGVLRLLPRVRHLGQDVDLRDWLASTSSPATPRRRQDLKHTTTAAVVAGFALVLGAAVPGTARASSTGTWTRAYQAPGAGVFSGLVAISRSDAWAVGYRTVHVTSIVPQPFIRHYDGTGWKAVTIPGARNFESDSVRASSARNVWVYGLASGTQVATTVAYRYDGSRWHKVPVPAQTHLWGLVTLSPGNTWAFGSSGTFPADIFHWDGSRWHGYNLDFLPEDISASSAANVWISGQTGWPDGRVAAARWNGSAWHDVAMPHPVTALGATMLASSPSDAWIGWGTATETAALRWDGHHWHSVTAPASVNASLGISRDGIGGHWFGPTAHLDGSTWTGVSIPPLSIAALGNPVLIPGTTSAWMPAGVVNPGGSVQQPTIYHLSL